MGVNAVVIVENSKGISLAEFKRKLQDDRWGKRAWRFYYEDESEWSEFEFEGKRYFTWTSTPRFGHLGLYEYDEEPDANPYRILFFKIMLAVEKISGGPVFVGNDMVNLHHPDEATPKYPFYLPPELDYWWRNWREIAEKFDVSDDVHLIY